MTQRKFELLWKKHCEFNNPQGQQNSKDESNEVKYIDEIKTESGKSFWDL